MTRDLEGQPGLDVTPAGHVNGTLVVVHDNVEARKDIAGHLASQFRRLLRERRGKTMHVGDRYVQVATVTMHDDDTEPQDGAAGDGTGFVLPFPPDEYMYDVDIVYPEPRYTLLVELQSIIDSRPGDPAPIVPAFDHAQEAALAALGFNPPERELVNWWGTVDEDQIKAIAHATVDALVDVCGIPLAVVDADVRLARRRPLTPPSPPVTTFQPVVGDDDLVDDVSAIALDYAAFTLTRRDQIRAGWPWASDVEPAFFAIVDAQDTRGVNELVALAPAGPSETRISWFRRTRRGWVADPTVARRLARARGERLRAISPHMARTVEPQLTF